jgi:glyoxylase-like metal-dependent hydrolase (beta-lactamase superfamily II)
MSPSLPTTCFRMFRLNPSTFVIREVDTFNEQPLIYAKIYSNPPLLLLSDTGCGGHGLEPSIKVKSLRKYLETYPVSCNSDKPINPDGKLPYLIICSHCHFDHILGIPDFVTPGSDTTILASNYDPKFITDDLPTHSICESLGIATPQYDVSYWANHLEEIKHDSVTLKVQILHTPGHTPDELAWYDMEERHLYVGDTLYELRSPTVETAIIFPVEGDWVAFMASLRLLASFIEDENTKNPSAAPVKIGAAHITYSVDGAEIVKAVQELFVKIIEGKVPVVNSMDERGETFNLWMENPEARFSVKAPNRLAETAREFAKQHPQLLAF